MKCPWKYAVLLSAVFSASALSAQDFVIEPSSIKIDQSFVKAPNFQVSKGYNPLPIPSESYKWLRILVSYVPSTENGKKNTATWEVGLSVDAFAIIPADPSRGYGKSILLSGQQVFYSVQGNGKKHYILFLVPPTVFSQYCAIKKYDKSEAEAIPVTVVFRKGSSKKIIATGYSSLKGRTTADLAKIFSGYYKSKIGVLKLEGAILPKEKTPWQWIDTDIFDLPQSISEGKK